MRWTLVSRSRDLSARRFAPRSLLLLTFVKDALPLGIRLLVIGGSARRVDVALDEVTVALAFAFAGLAQELGIFGNHALRRPREPRILLIEPGAGLVPLRLLIPSLSSVLVETPHGHFRVPGVVVVIRPSKARSPRVRARFARYILWLEAKVGQSTVDAVDWSGL